MLPAILSFLGSMLGAFISGFLAVSYKRHHDQCALAGALSGELSSYEGAYPKIKDILERLIDKCKELMPTGERLSLPVFIMPTDRVFNAIVAQVGLLPPTTAADVAFVYNKIGAFRSAFASACDEKTNIGLQLGLLIGSLESANDAEEVGKKLVPELQALAEARWRPWPLSR